MTFDEKALADALHAIDADVSPDLASRARAGGRRRLLRRRSYAAVGAVAVGAVAVPTTAAIRSGPGASGTIKVGASPNATDPGLYAAPPPAESECNSGFTAKVQASAHPDLLFLPPSGQDVKYAYVRDDTENCPFPHIAMTAYKQSGNTITQGVIVEGPNAPTAVEAGAEGPGIGFSGDSSAFPIDGQPAREFTVDDAGEVSDSGSTEAYWTGPDGGQWHATVRDMSQRDAVTLLNQMIFDSRTGGATLPHAAADGWTVVRRDRDRTPQETGWAISQWTDPQGHLVDLTVRQTPDATYQTAISLAGDVSFVTVRGHTAVLAPGGGNAFALIWQEDKDVEIQLAIRGGTAEEIQQVAESLQLASPHDPRFADIG